MSDLKTLELGSVDWFHVNKNDKSLKIKERYAHTMTSFLGRYLIVFGGASQFYKATKRRETLSDIWVYDCQDPKKRWVEFKTVFS
jgi:hypothetical protein